ncbi:MAG: response regulator [Candidatus Omnitrophota bacterium]
MSNTKILIIEDEKDLLTLLKMNLESIHKYEVLTAEDGQKGIDMALAHKPDLIILDLHLPKLPGEEVCRQIRRDKDLHSVPIIMATGKNLDADRIIGRVIGADAYITKPFSIEELFGEIVKLLGKEKTT